jgi:opacity protein-like surface antigen
MRLTLAITSILIALSVGTSHAEWYIAGQGGVTLPNGLTDVRGTGATASVKQGDLDQSSSGLYGFKIGYFFPGLPWLGLEGDFYHSNPHVKEQSVSRLTPLGAVVPFNVPGSHFSYNNGTLNIIARYPGKRFQPYIGGGVGVGWARLSDVHTFSTSTGQPIIESQSDKSLAYTGLAGLRFFATKHLAVFTEYKYTSSSFNFGGNIAIKADYTAHNIVAGVAFHF